MPSSPEPGIANQASPVWLALVCAAAVVGLTLLLDSIRWTSATYDEVAYLRVAARWWRTGEQTAISRMGSPLTFWRLQQAPVLWTLDRLGRRELIDDPIGHQQELLPLVRAGALWIWLAALLLCACWSRRLYGPRAMALAAWLFALSPNLIAHGGLATMELPLLACTTGMLFLFWSFLDTGRRRWFWASAGMGGLAFSCKFTTVLFPPILAVIWWLDGWRRGGRGSLFRVTRQVTLGMAVYVLVLLLADFAITGFAVLPPSRSTGDHPTIKAKFGGELAGWIARLYETPVPQDWVGLATQAHHQMSGGSSYLLGERRMTGWRYYYFVALAVKVPLTFWLLLAARAALAWRRDKTGQPRDDLLPLAIGLFLAVTAIGSAQLWTALPASPGAAGDRLDLSNGRGCDREARNSRGMDSLANRVGSGGTSPGRCGRSSVRADLLQRPGRWSDRRAAHPLRLEPGLGPGAQGAGPSPVRGARVSQPDTLLLRRYRPGLLRRGGYGPHRECRRRSISTARHPDRDDLLPGGFCLTPVGALGTARVFSKTGFDRTLPDDR